MDATEGVNVDGVVSLQSVSSTSSFAAIGPTVAIVSVADPSASSSVAASNNGSFAFTTIAPGTYDLIATASGFAPMQLSNQVIELTDITVISGTLSAGLVNDDEFVNLTDILLTINAFGTTPSRPDGSGNYVDLNADGFVNLTDILLAISRFGLSGTQPWQ
ncbi:MAG: dockerin type I domain-containing protein [Pirellulaceae bacterium]|nr:dockerin type I domain-containing protein [Pirellulaceae bacterium]